MGEPHLFRQVEFDQTLLPSSNNEFSPYACRMTFGSRLRLAREAKKMTQTQLGAGLGTDGADVSKAVVLGWEKDRHAPRTDQLAVICTRLTVNPDWLLMGHERLDALSPDAEQIARDFDTFGEVDRQHILSMWTVLLKVARKPLEVPARNKFKKSG